MAVTRVKPRRVIRLSDFMGVDFTSAETEVSPERSPESVNMIAGKSGRPELRPGYESAIEEGYNAEAMEEYMGAAKGIHFHGDTMILHTGRCYIAYELSDSGAYRYTGASFILGADSRRSQSFFMNGVTYLLDGTKYVAFDGESFAEVEGYAPTTSIGRKPSGGGSSFEAVNMLTRRRKNSFTADGTSKSYKVDGEIDTSLPVTATVGGVEKAVTVSGDTVTFTSAPSDDGGVDSVVVTFYAKGEGQRAMVEGCSICSVYGAGNPTRVFISGNPNRPATDWYSGLYDPEYFPDNSYTEIGTQDSAIMGYLKQYGSQIIVKEDKDGRSGLFLRNAQISEADLPDGSKVQTAVFTVTEGIQGTGAAGDAILVAGGWPLFLTKNGLMTLTTNSVTNQHALKNTSVRVNKRLLKEDLGRICAAAADDKLMLAIDGRVYVAMTETCGAEGFEWFYWEGIPGDIMTCHGGKLYFSDGEGRVYRQLSAAEHGMNAYNDMGRPITAEWWSPVFDGGEPMSEKTINARGTGVALKPLPRTSAKLMIRTNRTPAMEMDEYFGDIMAFEDVDFQRFSFMSDEIAMVGISSKRIRNIHSFQIGVRHETVNDGLELLGFTVDHTIGKQLKRQI